MAARTVGQAGDRGSMSRSRRGRPAVQHHVVAGGGRMGGVRPADLDRDLRVAVAVDQDRLDAGRGGAEPGRDGVAIGRRRPARRAGQRPRARPARAGPRGRGRDRRQDTHRPATGSRGARARRPAAGAGTPPRPPGDRRPSGPLAPCGTDRLGRAARLPPAPARCRRAAPRRRRCRASHHRTGRPATQPSPRHTRPRPGPRSRRRARGPTRPSRTRHGRRRPAPPGARRPGAGRRRRARAAAVGQHAVRRADPARLRRRRRGPAGDAAVDDAEPDRFGDSSTVMRRPMGCSLEDPPGLVGRPAGLLDDRRDGPVGHRRVDVRRQHRVGGHPGRGEAGSDGAHQAEHAVLRGGVAGDVGLAALGGHRRHHHDPAPALLDHAGHPRRTHRNGAASSSGGLHLVGVAPDR